MKKLLAMQALIVVVLIAAFLALSYGVCAGLFWIICFAFDFTFSAKAALGVWAIFLLVCAAFGGTKR